MKKQHLSFVFLLLTSFLFSCSKDKKTETFTYSVNNVQDQNITANGTTTMSIATTLLSGTTE